MIPSIARVRVRYRGRDRMLWIPLALVWLLLLPFAILLSPLLIIACLIARIDPWEAAVTLWELLGSLRGTEVDVDRPEASFSIFVF